jgi:hypothetical protein
MAAGWLPLFATWLCTLTKFGAEDLVQSLALVIFLTQQHL